MEISKIVKNMLKEISEVPKESYLKYEKLLDKLVDDVFMDFVCGYNWETFKLEHRGGTQLRIILYVKNVENLNFELYGQKKQELLNSINDFFPKFNGVFITTDTTKCGDELNESEITERCWKGYTQKGMKTMFGKRYPNCVKIKKKKESKEGVGGYAAPAFEMEPDHVHFKHLYNESDMLTHTRRRLHMINNLLESLMYDGHDPCDYDDKDHYFEQIVYDLGWMVRNERYGLNETDWIDIYEYVVDHKQDMIKEYFTNNCVGHLRESIKNALDEQTNNIEIKKLISFDFDDTLVHTTLPTEGKQIWKEKTGEEWPHRGWWSKPESLDMEVFDIPLNKKIYRRYKQAISDPDNYVILATGRVAPLKNEVDIILNHYGLEFDEIHLNPGIDTFEFKSDLFAKLIYELQPEEFIMYDDRQEHLVRFVGWANTMPCKVTIIDAISGEEFKIEQTPLVESIKRILIQEVTKKYSKPNEKVDKLVYRWLDDYFDSSQIYKYESWKYYSFGFKFCKNGREIANLHVRFDDKSPNFGPKDKRPTSERSVNEVTLNIYPDMISELFVDIPIRKNYLLYLIEEWFEDTKLDEIQQGFSRSDLSLDHVNVFDHKKRGDICIPPIPKPENISMEEMRDLIKKNTLYTYTQMEDREEEEPGWTDELYLTILNRKESERVNKEDREGTLREDVEVSKTSSLKDSIKQMINDESLTAATELFGGLSNLIKTVYKGDIKEFSKDTGTKLAWISIDGTRMFIHEVLIDELGLEDTSWLSRPEKKLGDFKFGPKNGTQYKFTSRVAPITINGQPYYKVVGTSGDSGFGYGFISPKNQLGKRYRTQIYNQIIDRFNLQQYM